MPFVFMCLRSPGFSKVFDTISHIILLQKLAARGLDGHTFCWVNNWLDG